MKSQKTKKIISRMRFKFLIVFLIMLLSTIEVFGKNPLNNSFADKAVLKKSPVMVRPVAAGYSFNDNIEKYLDSFTNNWLIGIDDRNPAIFDMFRDRDKKPYRRLLPWSGEFAGKHLTNAVQMLRVTNDAVLRNEIKEFVRKLCDLQTSDGYLGPWPQGCELTGKAPNCDGDATWDTWGHYHMMLGLMLWYEESNDSQALLAAEKIGDLLCEKFLGKPGSLAGTGSVTMNLAPVHSLAILYRHTAKQAYLDLAKQIIDKEFPSAGDYLRTAVAGKKFYETPCPRWESLHAIMGIAELYWITGNEDYRKAFEHIWWSILEYDRHNTGGFSTGEQACGNPYMAGPIETCCTIAWTAMSAEMLKMTGNSIVADEMELTFLNATLASLSSDGTWSTYDTPMDGEIRPNTVDIAFQIRPGSEQLNCCSVNASRGLGMVSDWALMQQGDGLVLNWYGKSKFTTKLKGTEILLQQQTNYPRSGKITLLVNPEENIEFSLKLRIPYWSRQNSIMVNGKAVKNVTAGTYLAIDRKWEKGDEVQIQLDMGPHYWVGERECQGKTAIYYGPILLALNDALDLKPEFSEDWWKVGKLHVSNNPNARLEYKFEGDSIKWIGLRYDDAGMARIEIDGKQVAVIDQYAPSRDSEPFVWNMNGLGQGDHKMIVTHLDKNNSQSKGKWLNVEKIESVGMSFNMQDIFLTPQNFKDDGSMVAFTVKDTKGRQWILRDFDAAAERGSYKSWLSIENTSPYPFSKSNPLRTLPPILNAP